MVNNILTFFPTILACGHGEILQSRALLYTQSDLLKSVEELKTQKQETEQPEDQDEVPIYFLFNIILHENFVKTTITFLFSFFF